MAESELANATSRANSSVGRANMGTDPAGVASAESTFPDACDFRGSLFARLDEQSRSMRDDLAKLPEAIRVRSRFQLREKIGSGGLGDVYRAYDRRSGRFVALKISRSRTADGRRDEFLREYRVTAKLQHPGIPAVYAAGRLKNGRWFYVMRLINGETLTERTRAFRQEASSPLAPTQGLRSLLNVLKQVCDTVAAAHDAGYVHLDLKPDNVIIEPHGATFVVDWGLARHYSDRTARTEKPAVKTTSQRPVIAGTVEFMAPEQLRGEVERFGPETDVYALGGILHYLLSGKPTRERPRQATGDRLLSFFHSLRTSFDVGTSSTSLHESLPPELASICRRALAVDPAGRYPSAHEIREEIERWERGADVLTHQYTVLERIVRYGGRHARTLVITAAILVALSAALGLASWHQVRAEGFKLKAAIADTDRRHASQVALTALEEQIAGVQREEVLRKPELQTLRIEMLHKAWMKYDSWAAHTRLDRDHLIQAIKQLHSLVLMIEESVSEQALLKDDVSTTLARDVAKAARDASKQLLSASPRDPEAIRLMATSQHLCATQESPREIADVALQAARAYWKILTQQQPVAAEDIDGFLRSERLVASWRFRDAMAARSIPERETLLREAAALNSRTRDYFGTLGTTSDLHPREMASLESQAGSIAHKLGDPAVAIPHYQRALSLLELMSADISGHDDDARVACLRVQANVLNSLGLSQRGLNQAELALETHRRAKQLRIQILESQPWLLSVRAELAQSLGNIADVTVDFDDLPAEIQAREEAAALLKHMHSEYPSMKGIQNFWALHRTRMTVALHRMDRDQEAAECFRDTIAVCPHPENAEPTNNGHFVDVAIGHCLLIKVFGPNPSSLDAAAALVRRCDEMNGFDHAINRSKVLDELVAVPLREYPELQATFEKLSR